MFSIDLPERVALTVLLPTGGTAMLIHLGGGRFLTDSPPLTLYTVADKPDQALRKVPVGWDSQALPPEVHLGYVAFDAEAAGKAVRDAAEAGDAHARVVVDRLKMIEARLAAESAGPALGEVATSLAIDRTEVGAETEGGAHD